jgi:hypothetical protein
MRVLKIIGDINIGLDLPKDTEVVEIAINDYMVTDYEEKFDMILCIHALQTLWADQTADAIQKLVDDLKEMGELHIHVPATEQATKALLKGTQDPVAFYMIWGSKERPFHSGFNLYWLRGIVENAGAIVRTATMGKFKMTSGDKELYAVEHVVIATVIRS